jgi:primosomal protein N'
VWLEAGQDGRIFTYANPAGLAAGPGDLVRVRLQGRAHTGLVVGLSHGMPPELRDKVAQPVEAVLQSAAVDPRWRSLIEAVARDTHTTLFRCLKSALPPGWLGQRPKRAPLPGMMVHQDASTHRWVADQVWDLVVTMDDATGEHTSMFFCDQESTTSSFHGIGQTIAGYGLFASLYTDRGSHYFTTPEAGGKVAKLNLTEVGRSPRQLGIEHIATYSPEARGRSERALQTHQGRLPQELARGDQRHGKCQPVSGAGLPSQPQPGVLRCKYAEGHGVRVLGEDRSLVATFAERQTLVRKELFD